jgi:hypothetical protein
MKSLALFGLLAAFVVGLVPVAVAADDMTLTGKVLCAKCSLKKADAKECQNVLVVTDDSGTTSEYYVVKNAVSETFGHVCKTEKPAVVTGQVAEKDGKMWITASRMEEKK